MVWWPTHTANNPDLFCHTKCKYLSVCLSLQFWMHFPSVAQRCYQNILGADTPTAETLANLVSLTRFQTWIYYFSAKVIFLGSEGQLILLISWVINSAWGIQRTNITIISQIQITFIFISISRWLSTYCCFSRIWQPTVAGMYKESSHSGNRRL